MLRASSNDDNLESVLKSLGCRGDVLIGITSAGESQNVIRTLKAAREMGITVLGLFGGESGPALQSCDSAILTMSQSAGNGQESQRAIGRALMELIEAGLLERTYVRRLSG
jgi:D-sedoheptulose 7-phosphate isomerase